jgi:preprotein translocase subunit SecF
MLRILHGTNFDFIRLRHWTYALTALFIIPGMIWIAVQNFNYSIEFTGGTLMQLQFHQAPNVAELRSTLDQAGIHGAEIQRFGSDSEYVVRAQSREQVEQQRAGASTVAAEITRALEAKYGEAGVRVVRTEAVGPKVGSELRQRALYAVLISFVITLIYLAWRFEWRFGVAAVIATGHDILATLAFIKYTNLEISLVVVGAILTMIGYSLNDTIIIFDRVRENIRKLKKDSLYDILNRSVNETLPRSVLTHATTSATLLALALLGGEVIRPFSLVMLFGVVTGTFSSIFVAAPVLLYIESKWPRKAGEKGGVGHRHVTRNERQRSRSQETAAAR